MTSLAWMRSLMLTTALCSASSLAVGAPTEDQEVSPPPEDRAAAPRRDPGIRAGEVALISVKGAVNHQDQPLTAAGTLPALTRLTLKSGATAFALLVGKAGEDRQLAVAMADESTVALRGPKAQVTLLRGNRIALSGAGTLLLRGWRVELEGSLLLHDFIIYVTHGQAKILQQAEPGPEEPELKEPEPKEPGNKDPEPKEPGNKTKPDAPRNVPLPLLRQILKGGAAPARRGRSAVVVRAGQAARLELGGGITAATRTPPAFHSAIWSALGAPPAWSPEVGSVKPGAVERAQQLTRQQLQTQRETASCGCTESSGSGGPAVNTGTHLTPVERTAATVKVRIIGMPRRIE